MFNLNKKQLVIGGLIVVGLAGVYFYNKSKKDKKTTSDKKDEKPASPYEGKNLYHGKESGEYIDGYVYKVQNGKKIPYDGSTPDLVWNDAVAKGALSQPVSQEVLDSIPNASPYEGKLVQEPNYGNVYIIRDGKKYQEWGSDFNSWYDKLPESKKDIIQISLDESSKIPMGA